MALDDDDDDDAGIPEWVVTFGDMMSLLLTFFIMLVSMSEVKSEERFQAMVESMSRRFGHDTSRDSMAPGPVRPRNSEVAKLATEGRAKRSNTHRGGDKVRAMVGDHPRVRSVRPGDETRVGGYIQFAEGSDELSEEAKQQLQVISTELAGKPQKIEIRGHTSQRPVGDNPKYRDNWDLAYNRCRRTMEFLVSLGIKAQRFRMSVAGANEPKHLASEKALREQNARVEVLLLSELTGEFVGGAGELDRKFVGDDEDPAPVRSTE
ncbi:MAG: OmpA family protein [Pirellulales bacterium]|nr:OmpA family protein [Pirellulales bacterium]